MKTSKAINIIRIVLNGITAALSIALIVLIAVGMCEKDDYEEDYEED